MRIEMSSAWIEWARGTDRAGNRIGEQQPFTRRMSFLSFVIAVYSCGIAAGQAPPPPTTVAERYNFEVSGGAVRFFAETGLFVIYRISPVGSQPDTTLTLDAPGSPWGFPPGGAPLSGSEPTTRFYDLLGMADPGEYELGFVFPREGEAVTRTFLLPEAEPTIVAPQPRVESAVDGSLRIEWDAVEGAGGYAVVLFEQVGEGEEIEFQPLTRSLPPKGELEYRLPVRSLEPGKNYVAAVYALSIDPHATPLPPHFTGDTGSASFSSSAERPALVAGDLNDDSRVDVRDATMSLRIAAGLLTPTDIQKAAGDVNKDDKLNIQDTTLILQVAVGLREFLPLIGVF